MNFKSTIIFVIFKGACAVGATLVLVGLIMSCWFFFVSELENKFYWGGLAFVVTCVGYVIYLYAFPKIHKKWEEHY